MAQNGQISNSRINTNREHFQVLLFGKLKQIVTWAVPLMFGLLSVYLGQDDNWDLRNYHLYNAYAFLNGRLLVDMAPAQMQTFFNPLIDLPYYFLTRILKPVHVGFIFGTIQGLNFILVLKICEVITDDFQIRHDSPLPLILAITGCAGVGFISEIGSTIGDNLTSLFVLFSILILLSKKFCANALRTDNFRFLLLAGALMGAGTGLKLTNIIYCMAACGALFCIPGKFNYKIANVFIFGVGTILGLTITGGYAFFTMWSTFGNPLFPQFNSLFQSKFAASVSVVDTHFLPKTFSEIVSWPFIFSRNPNRVSELWLREVVWPIAYLTFAAVIIKIIWNRFRSASNKGLNASALFLTVFFGLSYLAWIRLFSIYRYLIPIELIAPLVIWVLANYVAPTRVKVSWVLLVSAIIISVNFPYKFWSHAPWSNTSFRVDVPVFSTPEKSTILIDGYVPMGWIIPFFPKGVVFVGTNSNFPESPAWREKILNLLSVRSGPLFYISNAENKSPSIPSDLSATLNRDSCIEHNAYIGDARHAYYICKLEIIE